MITTGTFQLPYYVISIPEHNEIKETLLRLIDEDGGERITDNVHQISKIDFFLTDKEKKYLPVIMPVIKKALKNLPISFDNYTFDDKLVWYQQYTRFNHHCFHVHDKTWSMVYYLELDSKSPGTQFKPTENGEYINIPVVEGDLIVFPGWIEHRSPPNISTKRKTIIACDVNKNYSGITKFY
jgi:hypothetical protein